jgi:hypothetical protein
MTPEQQAYLAAADKRHMRIGVIVVLIGLAVLSVYLGAWPCIFIFGGQPHS